MSEEVAILRSFISKRGLRNTPEREMIVEEIFTRSDHFDVDELYLRLRRKGSKVSKASIYRNIPLILECGLIKEVWYENGHMHYEPHYGQERHCHLRCIQCGKVIEFYEQGLRDTEQRLAKQYDYKIIDSRLDVNGYCPDCQKGLSPSSDPP